jgi:hypothetical protein
VLEEDLTMAAGIGVIYKVTFKATDATAAGCVLLSVVRETYSVDNTGAGDTITVTKAINTAAGGEHLGLSADGDTYTAVCASPGASQFNDATATLAVLLEAAVNAAETTTELTD